MRSHVFALAMCACTQVEIQCGERGRVLTYIWNAYMTTHENVMRTLREDNNSLKARNKEVRPVRVHTHRYTRAHTHTHTHTHIHTQTHTHTHTHGGRYQAQQNQSVSGYQLYGICAVCVCVCVCSSRIRT